MRKKLAAPYIPEAERTPAVMKLLAWGDGLIEIILGQHEQELHLKDEVAVLKGEKKRPKFKPSRMHEEAGKAGAPDRQQQAKPGRRRGKPSRSKTAQLKIDCEEIIEPAVKRSKFETFLRRANLDIPRPISVGAPDFTLRVCELNFDLV